jgi:hypothetical protein
MVDQELRLQILEKVFRKDHKTTTALSALWASGGTFLKPVTNGTPVRTYSTDGSQFSHWAHDRLTFGDTGTAFPVILGDGTRLVLRHRVDGASLDFQVGSANASALKLATTSGGVRQVGFFGVPTVARQGPLTDANTDPPNSGDVTTDAIIDNTRTRVNEIEAALKAYGLLQ